MLCVLLVACNSKPERPVYDDPNYGKIPSIAKNYWTERYENIEIYENKMREFKRNEKNEPYERAAKKAREFEQKCIKERDEAFQKYLQDIKEAWDTGPMKGMTFDVKSNSDFFALDKLTATDISIDPQDNGIILTGTMRVLKPLSPDETGKQYPRLYYCDENFNHIIIPTTGGMLPWSESFVYKKNKGFIITLFGRGDKQALQAGETVKVYTEIDFYAFYRYYYQEPMKKINFILENK